MSVRPLHRGTEPLRRGTSDAREQLHPRLQLNSLLPRGFPQQAGVGVGSGAMVLVNIYIGSGQKPGGNYGAGMFNVITITSATV